ncbi:hypothetical protein [Endozoicomonas sp. YOMI1]|uniref:hypothetical protein n=1 Tax=Endozoicomonas sp. YOMI1 TaxID=2828739 RepID=UPI0021498EE1|nr:hypothetical protein [Endozoicomonas sp. YOMI1]
MARSLLTKLHKNIIDPLINNSDVKLLESQRLPNEEDGGVRVNENEVIDGTSITMSTLRWIRFGVLQRPRIVTGQVNADYSLSVKVK